jgi:predicted nuclease of predicted toxin-antitoxin system
MRFTVDECTGTVVSHWLRQHGHDVYSVYDDARGSDDDAILTRAHAEQRIVITSDKDFGELVFREKRPHCGVILLRLSDPSAANHIRALERLLTTHADRVAGRFTVVTNTAVRISPP